MALGPKEEELIKAAAQAGQTFVQRRGITSSPMVLVGEAPGADEERESKPFVGASGRELMKMASEAGIQTKNVWITNVYKVRPPDNKLFRMKELGIPIQLFHESFMEELHAFKPSIIVSLGATPLGALCPDTIDPKTRSASISKWRGSLLCSPHLDWPHYVVPVEHPAYILRMWGERQIAVMCLARAAEELAYLRAHGNLRPLPNRVLHTGVSPQSALEWVNECLAQPAPVSLDVEMRGIRRGNKTHYINVDMISLAKNPWESMCIPMFEFSEEYEAKLWRSLDQLMQDQLIIGQNHIGFDLPQLYRLGFEPDPRKWLDTMLLHHSMWIEMPHGLHFLGMQYTRQPFWKEDGALWKPGDNKLNKQRYNALDSAGTYEVALREIEELTGESILHDDGSFDVEKFKRLGWPHLYD